ncbi:MAG: hypothetical protein AB7R40_24230 [Nitrospiraceae bacterium]
MPRNPDARNTRDLARRLAADCEARMLTPEQIRQLRADARRSAEQMRAEFEKMLRPNLDYALPAEGSE